VQSEVIMAQNRKGYTFESFREGDTSTTTGGVPFVQCYYGVNDGRLVSNEARTFVFQVRRLHIVYVSHVIFSHPTCLYCSVIQTTNVFASVCLAFHCVWTWIGWIAIRGHGTHFGG
jgi:hypothetical protein